MKNKQLFKTEYFVYFFILLIPIFDFIFNQYIEIIEISSYIKLNSIKLVIPVLLIIYLFFKTKGKERLQFILIILAYLIYSSVLIYNFYNKMLVKELTEEAFYFQFKQIISLTIFVINFVIMYKIFYRKNMTKLRMSYNYASTIYLLSVLLLSLTSQKIILYDNLPLIVFMLSFIAIASLMYKEEKAYSLLLLVFLTTYYITMVTAVTAYHTIAIVLFIYIISILIEKIIKKESVFKIIKDFVINIYYKLKNMIQDLDKNKLKRLTSGNTNIKSKQIKGYDDKTFKANKEFKKQEFKRNKKKISSNHESLVLKEIRKRVKSKKKLKRKEKIKSILNSRISRVIISILLILFALLIQSINFRYVKNDANLNFELANNKIFIIYLIPLIFVLLKSVFFTIFKFEKIDREFIILLLLIIYITIIFFTIEVFKIDFSCAIIISTALVMLLNKIETNKGREYITTSLNRKIKKKRVVFGITNLTISGLSRILVDTTNSLQKKYFDLDITIFTIFGGGEFESEVDVKIISLFKKPFSEYNNLNKFFITILLKAFEPNIFNKYIRGNYDYIIAFDEKDILRIFSYSDNAKKIVWIHNKNYASNYNLRKEKKIISKFYSRYDHLVFTRERALVEFNKIFKSKKIMKLRKTIISNYVDPVRIFLHSESEDVYDWTDDTIALLTVVRLYKHKALDRFIEVHKKLLDDGLKHEIYIIGDGPEKDNLVKLIRKEKLQQSVFLLGAKTNPYPYIKKATYFCLFSEKEDYSIVLNEAKILNKDILITDTMTRDLVLDYPNVRIFENSKAGLYNGLKYILSTRNTLPIQSEYIYKNEEILRKIKEILN